ncbi:MAG: hypothetical protein MMC33_007284 [Icmadophila ericetorum]|nr:hypothetical protein [Icmadophila ericetorum]
MRSTILASAFWLASGPTYADPIIRLRARDAALTPISVPPSQNWDGDDGPWSSFAIQVGTPPQYVRVFISTSSSATWVVLPAGCDGAGDTTAIQDCVGSRGGVFTPNASSTWHERGYFSLAAEDSLGISASAEYGNDTIMLGLMGSGGPSLQNQVIGAYEAAPNGQLFLGEFGVNPQPTTFSTVENGQASFLTTLKNQGVVSSLSFGYTAGALYRLKQVLGSLTLGGFDASRLNQNNQMSFTFGPDTSRNLIVGIQSIASVALDGAPRSLLPNGILANIDSTIPYIYLPLEACEAFEEAFGLVYDNTTNLYLLNDTQHNQLVALNSSITFTLANGETGGPNISITLPYASFDLTAQWPLVVNSSRYFPLQRAANDTQYTLGRTFLQEAYLTVDWERSNFSVADCQFVEGIAEKLVAITSPSTGNGTIPTGSQGTPASSGSSSNGKTTGIAVGVVVIFLIVFGGAAVFFVRWRRAKAKSSRAELADSSVASEKRSAERIGHVIPKAELPTDLEHSKYELKGEGNHEQQLSAASRIAELSGSPTSHQKNHSAAQSVDFHRTLPMHHELPGSTPQTGELYGSEPSSLKSSHDFDR